MNPVARRELQERFRTIRSPLILSVWVLAAGVVTFLAFVVASNSANNQLDQVSAAGLGSVAAASSIGRFVLHSLLLGMIVAILFVVPGQAAVAVVGERERQTLQLLQVSQLSSWRIIFGKLWSALAYISLLLIATTPLMVIPVLLGGVSIGNILAGLGMVAATAIMVGAVSLWVSARAKSMQGAVLGAYVWTVVIVVGAMGLLIAELFLLAPEDEGSQRIVSGLQRDAGRELYSTWINPVLGMVDASADAIDFRTQVVTSPYQPLQGPLVERQGFDAGDLGRLSINRFDDFGGFIERPFPGFGSSSLPAARTGADIPAIRGPIWPRTLLFQALVSMAALWAAQRIIRVPHAATRRLRRRNHAT
jgi:ABC-type transport system involved in multi-copper enzyme maturation permease subunit